MKEAFAMLEQDTTEPPLTIAPWWHTALLIVPLLSFSILGSLKPAHHALSQHHVAQYLVTLAWEWILAALVFWGIRMRKIPLRQLLGTHRPALRDWRDDVILAAAFWIAAIIILAALGTLFRLAHLSTPQKTLVQLAPQNALELLLWVILSISAGICEELTFRGYLLQQFSRASRNIWIGVLASSLLFGVAHGYEGASGMIAIIVYGALFCVLAIKRSSLRPGMMAHAWHDIFSGIALMLLKHARVF
jgi:membrane protease YdiL (CAAX protease family)